MNLQKRKQKKEKRSSVCITITTWEVHVNPELGLQDHGTHRFCLPLAAKPSSVSMSLTLHVNLFAAATAPVKLDVIRAGVTDLGSTIIPLATIKKKYITLLISR